MLGKTNYPSNIRYSRDTGEDPAVQLLVAHECSLRTSTYRAHLLVALGNCTGKEPRDYQCLTLLHIKTRSNGLNNCPYRTCQGLLLLLLRNPPIKTGKNLRMAWDCCWAGSSEGGEVILWLTYWDTTCTNASHSLKALRSPRWHDSSAGVAAAGTERVQSPSAPVHESHAPGTNKHTRVYEEEHAWGDKREVLPSISLSRE